MSQEAYKINEVLRSGLNAFSGSGDGFKKSVKSIGEGNLTDAAIGGTGAALGGVFGTVLTAAGLAVEVVSGSFYLAKKATNSVFNDSEQSVAVKSKPAHQPADRSSPAPVSPPPIAPPAEQIITKSTEKEEYLNYKEMQEIAKSSGFKSVSELVNKLGVTYAEIDGKKGTTSGDLFVVNPSLAALQNKESKIR